MTGYWQRGMLWAVAALFAFSEVSAKPTVGVVLKSVRNEFFIEMAKGAEEYAKAHPDSVTLKIEGIQQEVDIAAQEAIIRQMIAQKVNALIVVPADSVAMLPVLMEAIRADILVINMDNKLDDRTLALEGVNIPFVGPSNFVGARSVGEHVAKALQAESKVGLIEGPPGAINSRARSDGFRAALRAADMVVAGVRSGYWDTELGKRAALDLLKSSPDVKALLCGNDNMAIGAAQALAELGLTDKVLIGGYDNIPGISPYIDDGRVMATADQYPGKQAQYALELALKALAQKTPQADLPGIVQTPVKLVVHR